MSQKPEDYALTYGDIRLLIKGERSLAGKVEALQSTFFISDDVAKAWIREAEGKR